MKFTKSLVKSLVLTLALSLGLGVAFAESNKSTPTVSKPAEKTTAEKNAINVNEKENCEKDTANCAKMPDCPKKSDCPKDMHCNKAGHCAKKGKANMHSDNDSTKLEKKTTK